LLPTWVLAFAVSGWVIVKNCVPESEKLRSKKYTGAIFQLTKFSRAGLVFFRSFNDNPRVEICQYSLCSDGERGVCWWWGPAAQLLPRRFGMVV